MPVPRWMAQVNKRVFNKLEMRRGKRPVISHVGRSSGKVYHTPLDAHRTENGFVFILMYTSESDWVKNVLAAGTAELRIGKDEWKLAAPRLITRDEAARAVLGDVDLQPGRVKGIEYLQMNTAT